MMHETYENTVIESNSFFRSHLCQASMTIEHTKFVSDAWRSRVSRVCVRVCYGDQSISMISTIHTNMQSIGIMYRNESRGHQSSICSWSFSIIWMQRQTCALAPFIVQRITFLRIWYHARHWWCWCTIRHQGTVQLLCKYCLPHDSVKLSREGTTASKISYFDIVHDNNTSNGYWKFQWYDGLDMTLKHTACPCNIWEVIVCRHCVGFSVYELVQQ